MPKNEPKRGVIDRMRKCLMLTLPAATTLACILLGCIPPVPQPDPPVAPIPVGGTLRVDLATTETGADVLTRIYGSSGDGRKGVPVAGGFDCDNDGFADTAFASIQASPFDRQGAGEVLLVFGDGSIGGTVDTADSGERVLKFAGAAEFEVTGAEIWMDDVNGDGVGDLLISRQNYSPTPERPGTGALTIVFGSTTLRALASSDTYFDLADPPEGIAMVTVVGANEYDRLGIWTRTGDVTGDGVVDIIVGADEADVGEELNRGEAYLIRGGAHLSDLQTIDLSDFGSTGLVGNILKIVPPADSRAFHLGATCNVADLDGNGRAEVLLAAALTRAGAGIRLRGAPTGTGISVGGAPNGRFYIVWDDNIPEGVWETGMTITVEEGANKFTTIRGDEMNGAFGEEIIGGLDYNGDERADLFLGDLVADGLHGSQSGRGYVLYDAAQLRGLDFIISAPPADVRVSLIEGPSRGSLGADTAAQGDFNKDGIADLAVGSPHANPQERGDAGIVHILFGSTNGWPELIDLESVNDGESGVSALTIVEGAFGTMPGDTGDTLCYSAAAADLNGDGFTDLIVNEMAGNGLAEDAIDVGNLLIISGAALSDFPSNAKLR